MIVSVVSVVARIVVVGAVPSPRAGLHGCLESAVSSFPAGEVAVSPRAGLHGCLTTTLGLLLLPWILWLLEPEGFSSSSLVTSAESGHSVLTTVSTEQ